MFLKLQKKFRTIYNKLKEYIQIFNDYISAENYNYLIQYIDKLIE